MPNPVYIYDAVRTPRSKGKSTGTLHEVKPIDLAAGLLVELQKRHDLDTSYVDGPGLLHFWAVASMAFCVGNRRWLCTVGAGRAGRAAEIEGQLVVTH